METLDKKPRKLLEFLTRTAPNKVFLALFFGALAGFAYTLIIPIVTNALDLSASVPLQEVGKNTTFFFGIEVTSPRMAAAFFLLCVFILIMRTLSQVMLQTVSLDATRDLRATMYDKISAMTIADVERVGPSRLHAAIANDVPQIMNGAAFLPGILINIATVLGLLGFLVYLNVKVFLFILATILFGVVTYRIPLYFGNRYYTQGRERFDILQEGIRGLIYGAKELKLHKSKRAEYVNHALLLHENHIRSSYRAGHLLVTSALNYGNLISFFAIGVATFLIGNYYSISTDKLIAIIMALLYITGPLGVIMNSLGPVLRGSVSLRKLNNLLDDMPAEQISTDDKPVAFGNIRLSNVAYQYPGGGSDGFRVGPLNLELKQGQITFLVGGNGSGKSTLGKLLTLHYLPDEGDFYIGDCKVTEHNRDNYRQHISAIYSDFYLFDQLYGLADDKNLEKVHHYLRYLGLEQKVDIVDNGFSTTALSDGQKKRLALIVAYLEDRSFYVFDEWAADQDPGFKAFFYEEILQGLKSAGKAVLVITHDDRYFHLADNLVRMDEGNVSSSNELKSGVISQNA